MNIASTKLYNARKSIYSDPNQSVILAFEAVEVALTMFLGQKKYPNEYTQKLRQQISTNGLKGWELFWDDVSKQTGKQNSVRNIDGGPCLRSFINAYLITIGRSDLSPYLARYDYSDRKVSSSLAEEALIRAEYIVSELEHS